MPTLSMLTFCPPSATQSVNKPGRLMIVLWTIGPAVSVHLKLNACARYLAFVAQTRPLHVKSKRNLVIMTEKNWDI